MLYKPALKSFLFKHSIITIKKLNALILLCLFSLLLIMTGNTSWASTRDQAKRLHDRLAGVPPTETVLQQMSDAIDANDAESAAYIAMENNHFYNVTLKNWATPWTNETGDIFAPLNDYTATVIGLIRDSQRHNNPIDFRQLLYGNILYVGHPNLGLPAYNNNNNNHYKALEANGTPLKTGLTAVTQSDYNGLPAHATAGIMTTRAAAKAFFNAGTNRAMFRFTFLHHLCRDMEQMKDNTRPNDRIRQDVTRSPGGDSSIFLNECMGCHAGMDPLAQSLAYYDYEPVKDANGNDTEAGTIIYNRADVNDPDTGSRVQEKYLINANNFPYGFVTTDDRWDNYWRVGQNQLIGWAQTIPGVSTLGTGYGAKSMGMELAHSQAFAQCQVEKAFKAVCFRTPSHADDRQKVANILQSFVNSNYNMKQVFAESAIYCMGE
jgi:hypothetical protein